LHIADRQVQQVQAIPSPRENVMLTPAQTELQRAYLHINPDDAPLQIPVIVLLKLAEPPGTAAIKSAQQPSAAEPAPQQFSWRPGGGDTGSNSSAGRHRQPAVGGTLPMPATLRWLSRPAFEVYRH